MSIGPMIVSTLLTLLPAVSAAYEQDSHYYLRFALSLATCFDWDEAHLIASGDWGMDENGATRAEMNPIHKRNKRDWHAFGHSDKRFHELWLRSTKEPDLEMRLIKLGQFMHFLEDWEAHAGYGIRMGHARDTFRGRDPDSLGSSAAKNHRMVQSALDHLFETCVDLGRGTMDRDEALIRVMTAIYTDGLMDDLFEASDPDWKRGKLGGFRPEGPAIKAVNKARVEEIVEERFKALPDKKVPPDFEPGTENGIPPMLAIPFDQDGRVFVTRSVREALREWAAASDIAPDVELSLEEAKSYYRGSRAGWRLLIRATNVGEIDSDEGQIEIVVINSDDDAVVAQTTEPLPVLQPGETTELKVSIPAKRRPESDVIIGAFARVGDLSAMNNEDWLMLGDAEEEPDVEIVTDVDPPPVGPESVRFLNPPRTFIIDDTVCILVTALTSGGDSTEKLDQVVFEILGGAHDAYYFQSVVPSRWSAVSTDSGLVAGKTFECYRPDAETRESLPKQDPHSFVVVATLDAQGTEPYTQEFPLDPEFVKAVQELARSTR